MWTGNLSALLVGLSVLLTVRRCLSARSRRLPRSTERVLIIGASSGIGRTLAVEYARLGVHGVCVVGRRVEMLEEVVEECKSHAHSSLKKTEVLALAGDFAEVGDMVRVRNELQSRWGGIDTVVVAAGVSALRPLLDIVKDKPGDDGIQHLVDVSARATRGNFVGPLVAAATFIPLLESSSPHPSILLVNSLASAIPAPTRALYASTKAASLHLYQALAIEHPKIAFTQFLPSTVEGDFRASAVDGGAANVREADPNKHGLKRIPVARRCIQAIEHREKHVFMPWSMGPSHLIFWLWPAFVEWRASVKYRFTPPQRT
ncbi:hypothetical protein MIND_00641400 [Mycena indigotica]|uniref:NAD(P)-binding protein n=1 Tax=Mycena indigotica TaxID=2126181 RepID=A0A8H6SRJ0_9AGAR|nr:uncharacterized protein MIND_00641400 [Mycena indigotica]KAF7304099.1 hypothetical protein MIND_00641400 [Mycena indigotica]